MDTSKHRHDTHGHDPRLARTVHSDLPGRKGASHSLGKTLLAAAVLAAAMGAGLWAAKTYLLRDWSARVAEAKRPHAAVGAGDAKVEREGGRTWNARKGRWGGEIALAGLSLLDGGRSARWPSARNRAWGRVGAGWMVCARAWRGNGGSLAERAFELALAAGAAEEDVYNARGAAELQGGRPGRAYRWFGLALEARPGHVPALFNRAICGARLHLDDAALADAAAYLARKPHDAAALRLAAALICQESREGEALALLERELAAGGERRLALDASELAMRAGAAGTALMHLDAAAEGGVSLAEVAQVYKGPLFDEVRVTAEGRDFTRRLAARARAQEGAGK